MFPGKTRQILGLSALRQAAPFIFSLNPPELVLSKIAPIVWPRPATRPSLVPSLAASRLSVVQ